MKSEVFVILGAPNSPEGELSTISKSRLKYCVEQYQKGNLILCTGGWGAHFNTAEHAHASYAMHYLKEHGLVEACFLDAALSKNTVDDAVKIKPIVAKLNAVTLKVITSNYHLDRVKLIFNEILKEYDLKFIGVDSFLEKEEYNALVLHEKKAITAILKNGLYY